MDWYRLKDEDDALNAGVADYMTEAEASGWVHAFSSAVYFFPILGALVADILWGKYKTILILYRGRR